MLFCNNPTSYLSILVVSTDDLIRNTLVGLYSLKVGRKCDTQVFEASTPEEAESVLAQNAITHVICDSRMNGRPTYGTKLISRWKLLFPSIRKGVLYNRSLPNTKYIPFEVDQVLDKQPTLGEVWRAVDVNITSAHQGPAWALSA